MKKMTLVTVLLAFCFATGFTCSKNAPQQAAPAAEVSSTADAQNQMAAPPETATVPVPVPAETSAQPATETK